MDGAGFLFFFLLQKKNEATLEAVHSLNVSLVVTELHTLTGKSEQRERQRERKQKKK